MRSCFFIKNYYPLIINKRKEELNERYLGRWGWAHGHHSKSKYIYTKSTTIKKIPKTIFILFMFARSSRVRSYVFVWKFTLITRSETHFNCHSSMWIKEYAEIKRFWEHLYMEMWWMIYNQSLIINCSYLY